MAIFEEIVKVCEAHFQPSYSTAEIVRLVNNAGQRLNPRSIIPSDYCYNRINLGVDFTKHIFIDVEGRYRYVGEDFPYFGPIYWNEGRKAERTVGFWESGRFELWEDFPKVSIDNPKRGSIGSVALTPLAAHEDDFAEKVGESLRDNDEDRRKRLKVAPKIPTRVSVHTLVYVRNPDVVAEVLRRAKGKCEGCGNAAPFLRRKDGEPYLEVHHKIQLARGGADTVENAIALCPNCHRREHFGV